MKLTQLQYFKAVAETGRISLAAKKLFVSAPAVSIAIANLEKELGIKLFDRSNNKIVLNEQGKLYLARVNRILEDLDSANEELQIDRGDDIISAEYCDPRRLWYEGDR